MIWFSRMKQPTSRLTCSDAYSEVWNFTLCAKPVVENDGFRHTHLALYNKSIESRKHKRVVNATISNKSPVVLLHLS
jgi:hypothetical protein